MTLKKAVTAILALALLLCTLTACNGKNKYAETIVGRWECTHGSETLLLVFNGDGTGTATITPATKIKTVKLLYSLNGEVITIESYPTDDKGIAIGKGEYDIRYYEGCLLIRPKGSASKPNSFYRLAD